MGSTNRPLSQSRERSDDLQDRIRERKTRLADQDEELSFDLFIDIDYSGRPTEIPPEMPEGPGHDAGHLVGPRRPQTTVLPG